MKGFLKEFFNHPTFKKTTIYLFVIFVSIYSEVHAQCGLTYSPDSSALTLLPDRWKLDSSRKQIVFDFGDMWNFQKSDSMYVWIKGEAKLNDLDTKFDSTHIIWLPITIELFGKKYTQKVRGDGDINFLLRTTVQDYKKGALLSIRAQKKTRNKVIIWIDSVDIAGVPYKGFADQ